MMKENKKMIYVVSIMVVLVITIIVCVVITKNRGDQIKLPLSSGEVSAKVVEEVKTDSQNYDLEEKTLDEVITKDNTVIFEGIVKNRSYMELEVGSLNVSRAVLHVEVKECLSGNLQKGDVVDVLTHTNCTVSRVADEACVGCGAVFIAKINDDGEKNYIKSGDSKLVLKDIAKYSLPNGQLWLFVDNGKAIVYDKVFYNEMGEVNSLDEVKSWIKTRLQ